jgi:pyridoxamine 5'-phosphate oxidase
MATDLRDLNLSMDPFENFQLWLAEAKASMGEEMATAMTLATASKSGRPSARIVLFKGTGHDPKGLEGFKLFGNYESQKSRELLENAQAALVFFWPLLGRQIRAEGPVERLSDYEADIYFASRPRGSRLGAWASPQSQKIKNREELIARLADVEKRFGSEGEVPRPQNWGGWLLVPERFEFWQAGEFRLHDRYLFERSAQGAGWQRSRLAP